MKQPQRIDIAELRSRLDRGDQFLLIDLREDSELERDGAIPGAVHLPVSELELRIEDLPKDVEIVFY